MKKFEVTATYRLQVQAEDDEEAHTATLSALHDVVRNIADSIPEDDEETQLAQVFEWKVTKLNHPHQKQADNPIDRAKRFLAEYETLCKKYGIHVTEDGYTETGLHSHENTEQLSSHIAFLLRTLDPNHL